MQPSGRSSFETHRLLLFKDERSRFTLPKGGLDDTPRMSHHLWRGQMNYLSVMNHRCLARTGCQKWSRTQPNKGLIPTSGKGDTRVKWEMGNPKLLGNVFWTNENGKNHPFGRCRPLLSPCATHTYRLGKIKSHHLLLSFLFFSNLWNVVMSVKNDIIGNRNKIITIHSLEISSEKYHEWSICAAHPHLPTLLLHGKNIVHFPLLYFVEEKCLHLQYY